MGLSKLLIPWVFATLVRLPLYATSLPASPRVSRSYSPDFRVLSDTANIPPARAIIAAADLAIATLAGALIFPVVFTFVLKPAMGTELAFSTSPQAFETMPFGAIIGVAFFGALFVAAITRRVSMLEVGVAALTRTTALSRTRAAAVTMAVMLLVGLPSALSYSALGACSATGCSG